MRRFFWFVLLLLFVLLAACEPDTNDEGTSEPKLPPPDLPIAAHQAQKLEVGSTTEATLDPAGGSQRFGPTASGLDFTLSDADAPKRGSSSSEQETQTEALSAEEAAALLARLPDLPTADTADFALRAATLKPPLAGSDVQTPFPPNDTLPPPTAEALAQPSVLKVLRYQPQGVVADIPKLSVTFSSPMVPLTSVSEAHKGAVPLSLEPQLEGEWRWLDTKTLQFLPSKPLAMSTRFVVSAKKGTKSETGAILEEAFSWAFETPRINLTGTTPTGGDQELNPIIDLAFDQPIDARAVLNTVTVSDGSKTYGTRLLSQQRTPPGWATPGQSLAFELTQTLPKAANITVQVGPGTPSKAGPLLTETAPSFSFQTYGPF
ncbi:MAG: hypothetical protein CO108_16015 [Deltaproteobacteria bacterium CG_4_9_14_3_um_filter_63_12]|nr:MAG: hypothetical protein CO108_16015 [Deltaproteobacteria bacterium CG_4_9_14_3_um_filter_63_12]